jgi:hypothetical protein
MPKAYENSLEEIRQKVQNWGELLPHQIFPSGNKWYRHPKVELTKERPYEEVPSPLLRKGE